MVDGTDAPVTFYYTPSTGEFWADDSDWGAYDASVDRAFWVDSNTIAVPKHLEERVGRTRVNPLADVSAWSGRLDRETFGWHWVYSFPPRLENGVEELGLWKLAEFDDAWVEINPVLRDYLAVEVGGVGQILRQQEDFWLSISSTYRALHS